MFAARPALREARESKPRLPSLPMPRRTRGRRSPNTHPTGFAHGNENRGVGVGERFRGTSRSTRAHLMLQGRDHSQSARVST